MYLHIKKVAQPRRVKQCINTFDFEKKKITLTMSSSKSLKTQISYEISTMYNLNKDEHTCLFKPQTSCEISC